MTKRPAFDLAAARQHLAGRGDRALWCSVDELADCDDGRHAEKAEFAAAATGDGPQRREFLRLMGASLMLSGLAGCGEGRSDLALPYVEQPEQDIPGVPRVMATAVLFDGFAQPALARVNSGRPTKLDGNLEHPAVRGASDVFLQSALLALYDPDRSKQPMRNGIATTWAAVDHTLAALRARWTGRDGEGLRILTGDLTSPTLARQLRALLASLPKARLHIFEPVGRERRAEAMRRTFGRDVEAHYALETCEVIVSFDDDLLGPGPQQVGHARGWSQRRGEARPGHGRSRLYAVESVPGLTGAVADARLPADVSRVVTLAAALAVRLGLAAPAPELSARQAAWIETAARDLEAHAGRSLVTCGGHLPAAVQALAPFINQRLGNVGHTVDYREPVTFPADAAGSVGDLARDMAAGSVDTLIVLDCNPAYAAPGALQFERLIATVGHTLHAGLYHDETAAACQWHLPLAHPLESWGDARAVDGTTTIIQPTVAPLYGGRTPPQVLAMLAGAIDPPADAPVRETWKATFADAFEARWRQALHDGLVADTAAPAAAVVARAPDPGEVVTDGGAPDSDHVEIVFRPDPCVWDGRFANIAWLQEMPKPLTKITWDCPIAVSPQIADRLRLSNGDLVEVAIGGRSLSGACWIMPNQGPNTVALYLGYGRRAGGVARDLGYSAYALRPADDSWLAVGAIRRLAGRRDFAVSQMHHRLEGFDLVKEVDAAHPSLPPPPTPHSLYPEPQGSDYAWAMAIDLDRCIGCNACIAACNVENNVLVVGKEEVARGREMLWLRVDHYYSGDVENPREHFQPVPCMHCEKAPCEMGCPVNATVHSPEGLNQQVYNRCIGTRTCSSYCPYKVRRFNWYDYRRFDEPSRAAHNPDVTVRSRGVMEKCTYCTQRIEAAHVTADKEGRPIRPGEVQTACQQACPTTAITFGNIRNSDDDVAKLRRSGRHYGLLEELGTRPRTTYLARWKDEPGKTERET